MSRIPYGAIVISKQLGTRHFYHGIGAGESRITKFGGLEHKTYWNGKDHWICDFSLEHYYIYLRSEYSFYLCSKCGGKEPTKKGYKRCVCVSCQRIETLKNLKKRTP